MPFEAQSNRASGLNLVATAIEMWNTVYLERAMDALRAEGVQVLGGLLTHVSPLSWEHIGLMGDYVWRPEAVPDEGAYQVSRE